MSSFKIANVLNLNIYEIFQYFPAIDRCYIVYEIGLLLLILLEITYLHFVRLVESGD